MSKILLQTLSENKFDNSYCIRLEKNYSKFSHHYHDYYELEFIIDGKAKTSINGVEFALKRGSAYILRPTDLHEFFGQPKADFYSISVNAGSFDQKLYSEFISKNTFILTSLSEDELNYAITLCESLKMFNNDSHKNYQSASVLNLLLLLFLEKFKDTVHKENTDPIYGAIKYVNENFTKNPSLSDVASFAGLAETYFCRKFKKVTGKTYVEYLNTLKIGFAKRLLSNSPLSVTEICYLSGYNSLSQFIREFKKDANISPKNYRTYIKQNTFAK
jgi:AraC-like DNA-binding protein